MQGACEHTFRETPHSFSALGDRARGGGRGNEPTPPMGLWARPKIGLNGPLS